ncbi:hypothetical protein EWM64_g10021 [Hericium alpestre]|uniref:Uncharacterized protein n=1 Tax=Hericium alpestre TaxID=135208 RepID=A0A4Y9ZH97_9AGAM|nr:hypothetical protein EWM64_g10021 [Hericium alpestre]
MPAQRNTKQPLVKEQRKTKSEAPPRAQSASTPIICIRSPTLPKLLALIELDARSGP